jgi:nickel/cobalt transporter (NiCoT) family protein
VPAPIASAVARMRAALTPAEWRRVGFLGAAVLGLHLVGFCILLVPLGGHGLGTGGAVGLGVGITAYTLGLRHAFDADHIAAIDNTTRRLIGEGQRPLSVGFFFSLGHSSIVLALGVAIGFGVRGLGGAVADDGSALHQASGVIGPLVSGTTLLLIGLLNLVILANVVGIFRAMRRGQCEEGELERQLERRGFMSRFYGRATRAVRRPWHAYPLGLLFGLGFDTATEVALLVLAGGAGAAGLPIWAVACLPILFAAGMSLLDTLDGVFMNFAYGWALSRPIRKVFYNLTVTGLSVAVAVVVGGAELLSVLADELGLRGGIWDRVSNLDLNLLGYAIAALFVLTWVIAVAVWRLGRVEERWSAPARGSA